MANREVRGPWCGILDHTAIASWSFDSPTLTPYPDRTERSAWSSAGDFYLQDAVLADGLLDLWPSNQAKPTGNQLGQRVFLALLKNAGCYSVWAAVVKSTREDKCV